jgi:murein endopeptidase
VEAGVGPAAQIEAHFRNSAEYAAQAAAALAAGDSVEKAMGGYIGHFASGGAVGTDTIPAMLSPGEFVINADSSRKFFSQLVAMNAGVAPAHRQQGGTVNNVGDISINVNGNGDARTTGRALLAEIRREIRRGTGIL